uniref:Uncharacterized protein n=1 Tax=Alexandrium catenella TaxID=2925 RepID=A0A7S1S411_ALECA|mmetsp:Transcript_85379/g.226664  ORF Transcript_85379/g.226664 Transcript_85379/m.226664 type:complete len:283 (+) Transcript_85379:105-953(+)
MLRDFCLRCCTLVLVIAGGLAALCSLAPVALLPVVGAAAIVVLLPLLFAVDSCRRAEVRHAAECAEVIFAKRSGQTPGLPDKLRGVFWFATNKAEELLFTLEGEEFDKGKRRIAIASGAPYNWTYNADCEGWSYWFSLRLGFMFCSKLHINFEDDEMTSARMPLYLCNCIRCPMGMWWTLKQIDENTWDRPIFLYCMPWRKWEMGSYIFKRVIDENGNRLPAFNDMVKSVEEGLEGYPKKPAQQIMNGTSGCSCFARGGDGGSRTRAARVTPADLKAEAEDA